MKKPIKKPDTLALAKDVAAAADDIQAIDLKILDMRKLSSFTDFFIIASGNSDRQVEAIAHSIIDQLKKKGRSPIGVEGLGRSQWVLVDFGDVVAHIFYHQLRNFYALDKLWSDAKRVRVPKQRNKK